MSSGLIKLFANRMKSIREGLKLSQEDFAEICEVDRTYIGRLERMERNPSLETLERIAKALHVEVHELLNFKKDLKVKL